MSEKKRPSGYYAKVLGTFWRHPRTCGLSMAARGLWVSLLSWSADNLSDGAMPDAALLLVASGAPLKKERAELETSGLLVRNESRTGWVLRDWAQHNITRDKYERDKERARNGMANTRAREPSVTRNSTPRNIQPSDQDQDQDQDHRAESARDARAPEPSRLDSKRGEAARRYLADEWKRRTGAIPPRLLVLAGNDGLAAQLCGLPDRPALDGIVERFFNDPAEQGRGYHVGRLLTNPLEWGDVAASSARDEGAPRERPKVQQLPPWERRSS